jgi:hypothetical protein
MPAYWQATKDGSSGTTLDKYNCALQFLIKTCGTSLTSAPQLAGPLPITGHRITYTASNLIYNLDVKPKIGWPRLQGAIRS